LIAVATAVSIVILIVGGTQRLSRLLVVHPYRP
jgi:hypothetical protein